ncbi:MAG: toxin HicA [Firmicutes bacterium]|nr:toxin HicA [Bacillota bacterium]
MEKIKRNPKAVRFEELDLVLTRAGFVRSQPRRGSSHYVYRRGPQKVTVPRRQPYVLQEYVKRAIKALESAEGGASDA